MEALSLLLMLGACAAIQPETSRKGVLELDPMLGDNAVLQREQPIVISGAYLPNAKIEIEFLGKVQTVSSDSDGHWTSAFAPASAGGPYELEVTAQNQSVVSSNIMIGEVWLCGGQSNMDRQMNWVQDGAVDISNSTDAQIRFFKVPKSISLTPRTRFDGAAKWQVSSPNVTSEFSAVCYFFGRKIQRSLGVPVGLIAASWGGTHIESWVPRETLNHFKALRSQLSELELLTGRKAEIEAQYRQATSKWWRENDAENINLVSNFGPHDESSTKGWQSIKVPARWKGTFLNKFNGVAWYQRRFDLEAPRDRVSGVLSLGKIDDYDTVWINGYEIGSTDSYSLDRSYEVPAGILHKGTNLISIRVLDAGGDGGFLSDDGAIFLKTSDGEKIPLSGTWSILPGRALSKSNPYPKNALEDPNGLSVLYNGMIAPIGHAKARGVLWYQGETNARAPDGYAALLGGLAESWRQQMSPDLKFLIVQLPKYAPPTMDSASGNWPRIREAQAQFVSHDPRATLVPTIDTGEIDDIHPQNKRLVGERSATLALANIYHAIPVIQLAEAKEVQRVGDDIVVSFETGSQLHTSHGQPVAGFEICDNSCRETEARIDGDRILIKNPANRRGDQVRYAFFDFGNANLRGVNGLPVLPFRMEIKQESQSPSHTGEY